MLGDDKKGVQPNAGHPAVQSVRIHIYHNVSRIGLAGALGSLSFCIKKPGRLAGLFAKQRDLFFVNLQHCHKRFLRDVQTADGFHAFFAFFLFFQQFAFAGNIAAVALGDYVFAVGRNRFARDDFAVYRGLAGLDLFFFFDKFWL